MLVRQLHKFGGSSLADVQCYQRVASILQQYSGDNDLVVVSAAGSTTNQLIKWADALESDGRVAHEVLQELRAFQTHLIEALLRSEQQSALLESLAIDFSELNGASWPLEETKRAYFLGMGEVWSSKLLAALLCRKEMPAVQLDSRHFLRAEKGTQPEVERVASKQLLMNELAQHHDRRVVITGFMAQDHQGNTVLLGRNGSDYSATVIGLLAEASRVTIWSDVAGVYSADPRIVEEACLLPLLRLDEASELARLAAPVLHSRTLQPVAQSAIDLNLRCSHAPESGSTRIERVLASGRGAKIVTSLDDVVLLDVSIEHGHDFERCLEELSGVLAKAQLVPLAEEVQADRYKIRLAYTQEVARDVQDFIQVQSPLYHVDYQAGYSIVAAVGAGVTSNALHCFGFYQQLKHQPLEFVYETESELSLVAVLRQGSSKLILNALHAQLFQAQKRIAVALCGRGNIGASWLSLFETQQDVMNKRYGMQFDLVCVADSKNYWLDLDGLDAGQVTGDGFEKHAVRNDNGWLAQLKEQQRYDEIVVIDATASAALTANYIAFAEHGFHLISANKLAGSAPSETYHLIQDAFSKTGRSWHYNATVGAGLPINHTVRDLHESGDTVVSFSGIFSGTLSWLFQQYTGDIPFSELVEQAWQQGLTEPDPRKDLDGSDVMRKLVILARESGLDIEPQAVKVESLVPEALNALSADEFFDHAEQLDDALLERVEKANEEGKVLRYVARLDRDGKASVGVEALPSNHALANLLPCDNIFAIESVWYKDNPLVIRGPGAGRDVTAGAIQSDLNRIAASL
jgi:aspartokinase/homoserine dehydrogenase 2